jgi:hypothetical protein
MIHGLSRPEYSVVRPLDLPFLLLPPLPYTHESKARLLEPCTYRTRGHVESLAVFAERIARDVEPHVLFTDLHQANVSVYC